MFLLLTRIRKKYVRNFIWKYISQKTDKHNLLNMISKAKKIKDFHNIS